MNIEINIEMIAKSGLFDEKWYLKQCPYIKELSIEPIKHYLLRGYKLGYEPSKSFKNNLVEYTDIDFLGDTNPLLNVINSNFSIPLSNNIEEGSIKICIASSGIIGPTGAGGVAKCTSNLIDLVKRINNDTKNRKNIELTILYTGHPYYHSNDFEYWKKQFESKFINVTFNVVDTSIATYGTAFMKRSYNVLQYFNKSNITFDKIIFHDFQGIGYYTTLAKKSGLGFEKTKLIINTHGNLRLSNFFGKKMTKNHEDLITMFMETKSVENSDFVISPSQFYLNWWKDYATINDKQSMVLNNIAHKEIDDDLIESANNGTKYNISFFGRLETLKGISLLIQALNHMEDYKHTDDRFAEVMNNITVNFIGNSVDIFGVKSTDFIKNNCVNIIEHINIITDFDTKKAFEYMRSNNSVMVLPTLGENSPCVISEALVNEVPFIASDIPGIKELLHEDDHFHHLFKTGSKLDLIEGIIRNLNERKVGRLNTPQIKVKKEWAEVLLGEHNIYGNVNDSILYVKNEKIVRPLVSVVIPTYNRYDELSESIQSVKNQNYTNLEIIVVDDDSDDKVTLKEICSSHQVKLITDDSKLYKGAACNLGAANALGKYVLFFDDDDFLKENAVCDYVKVLESRDDIDICSCFCDVFEDNKYQETGEIEVEYTSLALGNYASGNLISNYYGKGSFIVRRDKFVAIGGYDIDGDNTHLVDFRFYTKASSKGLAIHVIPSSLYYYRKNSTGSLYYQSANNEMKLFEAKSRIFNTLKHKVDPSLHDIFSMLYMQNSYPKVKEKVLPKTTLKWLPVSRQKIYVVFPTNKTNICTLNLYSSDFTLVCHLSFRPKNKSLIINHKVNDEFGKEAIFNVADTEWFDKNAVSIHFEINGSSLKVTSKDLGVSFNYDVSHCRNLNIRKLVMGNEFYVI